MMRGWCVGLVVCCLSIVLATALSAQDPKSRTRRNQTKTGKAAPAEKSEPKARPKPAPPPTPRPAAPKASVSKPATSKAAKAAGAEEPTQDLAAEAADKTDQMPAEPAADQKEAEPKGPPSDPDLLLPQPLSEVDKLIIPPRTIDEYWVALERALTYGRFDNAKRYLSELLGRKDLTPEAVLQAREKHGSALLLKLERDPELAEPARKLIDMANEAARAQARDAERIRHFIANLGKSAGERGYAIIELRRSGAAAIPHYVDALKVGKIDRLAVLEGLFAMNQSSWPAVAACLDSGDEGLMITMIDVLRKLSVPESADSLWYVAASEKYSTSLRGHAREALAYLTSTPANALPSSVAMLERSAERYYRRRLDPAVPTDSVESWGWTANGPRMTLEPLPNVLEQRCLKAARQALELEPNARAAKIALLSMALHVAYEKVGIDQQLPNTPTGILELTLSAGPGLLSEVLESALRERRNAVILGAVRALGNTGGETLLAERGGRPGLLVEALNYPNPRVQFAAALATLNLHPKRRFHQADRIVQTLVRAIDSESRPVALVVDGDDARANGTRSLLEQLGYDVQVCGSGRTGFEAAASSVVDLVVVEPTIRNWGLSDTLVNFAADARTGGIPIAVFGDETALGRLSQQCPQVRTIPRVEEKDALAKAVALRFDDPTAKPLSPAEKAAQQRIALDWIGRIARGELAYFDVQPASDALANVMNTSAELGAAAADALGHLPSSQNQSRLATAVLNASLSLPVRLAACSALSRNIQRSGRGIDNGAVNRLLAAFDQSDDPELRLALARLAGALGPEASQVAQRVLSLQTRAPKPAAKAAPKLERKPEEPAVEAPTDRAAKPADESAPAAKPAAKKARKSFFEKDE